jgi:hypothetical protein
MRKSLELSRYSRRLDLERFMGYPKVSKRGSEPNAVLECSFKTGQPETAKVLNTKTHPPLLPK